jgi:molybdopterin-binding protein
MRGGAAAFFLLIGIIAMSAPSRADTIQLYAAGSLRAALTEVAKSFEAETGNNVQARYGPSGLLKDEIAGGARADVFASANMEHPQALSAAKKIGPVQLFARNRLCALVKSGLKVDSANLLERMLDPAIKLATSTPKADPSGDYALEVFAKAESIRPGARAALEKKAAQLTGSADSAQPPAGPQCLRLARRRRTRRHFPRLLHRRPRGAKTEFRAVGRAVARKHRSRCRLRSHRDHRRAGGGSALCAIHPLARRTEDPDQLWFRPRQIKVMLMKLSARNQLKGKIVEVKKGVTTTHVRIDIGGQILTASITNEAADELKLAAGQTAYAVIKATSVMVAVD